MQDEVKGFTEEEKLAMKERLRDEKGEKAVLAKIAEMPEPDRSMARRLHELIKESAPDLSPRTWYGMPAYTNREGKVVCYFQVASRFKERYATLGFQHEARLDDGNMWPTSFALAKLTDKEEARITALVKKAVS